MYYLINRFKFFIYLSLAIVKVWSNIYGKCVFVGTVSEVNDETRGCAGG